jgi:hypothetical protein
MRAYAVRLLRLRRIEFSVHTGDDNAIAMVPTTRGQMLCLFVRTAAGERREQGGDTMALVVMGYCGSAPLFHRQTRLGAIKRLNLALVDRQDDGVVGWVSTGRIRNSVVHHRKEFVGGG